MWGGNLPLKGPASPPSPSGVSWLAGTLAPHITLLTPGSVREDVLPRAPGGQLTRAVRSSKGQFNLRRISSCKNLINQRAL